MKATNLITAVFFLMTASSSNATKSNVYFGMSDGKGIYVAEFDARDGTLSAPRLAVEIEKAGFLAIHPNRKFIYSTCRGGTLGDREGAAAMKINPDGSLTLMNRQASDGQGACHISVDKTGQCVMLANYGSGSVASFEILEDGSLSEVRSYFAHEGSGEHPTRQTRAHAHSVFPNPQNTHAYACDLGIDKVMIYEMNPDKGMLSPAGFAEVPGGSRGPRHMKWNAGGTLAYVLNELDLTLSVFRAADNGRLELLRTVPVMPDGTDIEDMTCAEIRIHPNGKFVYTSNRDLTDRKRDSISVFKCFEDGLDRLDTVHAEVWIPRNFNIDPTGKWMLVGGKRSKDIALFEVDPRTGLIRHTGNGVKMDGGPICIEFLD
jgi:6-phosphogluconolactonase